jgi:hypothetical protein
LKAWLDEPAGGGSLLRLMPEFFYFRRSLELHPGAAGAVVYVTVASDERMDPVDVLGAFPPGWRPTDLPGQVLHDDRSTVLCPRCQVPRSQFRHYTRLDEPAVVAIYPRIRTELERDL